VPRPIFSSYPLTAVTYSVTGWRQRLVRIAEVVDQISETPEIAGQMAGRPGVHVVALVRHPYKIFYRVLDDRVRILHIRHTSRRPWAGGQ
jgi:plasmid stabilization system protein ParE